jgi:hypothetical protein
MAHAAVVSTAHQGGPLVDPLEQAPPRSRAHASLGRALPRSRENASLEWAPPRSMVRAALEQAPPRSRAFRARTPVPVRAFNVLTIAGRRHHAPGARTPVLSHQLPRREPIPATVGDCAAWPVPAPWRRAAYSSTANAPSPRRGAGRTLDLLSRDLAGLGCGVRPAGRHSCHC